eukprot:TRINITY_DN4122_c0_g1_i1.p1 TRINITY_DN4122_c0_g1~~TRINITY_DN4122_c0_g1_i1.p1  ORF type:complete len:517 (-),score=75.14 TRINITY_DN4122_c0_g1_i1:163-1713(-)
MDIQHTPPLTNNTTDINDHKVYTYMRSLVISGIFFLVLYIFSHFSLRRYFSKRIEYDEFERAYLPFVLCSFCFSISLGAMLLMPITIISNEILVSFPNNYYLLWLDRSLVFDLWNWIYWGVNISLFFILPFSYFLYEAVGKSFFARLQEAAKMLSLVSIIFGGFVLIVHLIVSESNESFDYIPFSYTIISTTGSLIVLFCTPRGFTTLMNMGLQLYMPFSSRQSLNDKLKTYEIEEEVTLSKLNEEEESGSQESPSTHSHYTTINVQQEKEELTTRLKVVREEKKRIKGRLSHSPITRNFLSFFFTLINFACSGYVVLRVLFHLITRFIDPSASSKLIDFLNLEAAADLVVVNRVEAFIQTVVVIYMIAAAFMGFYSNKFIYNIRPRKGDTSMESMVFNTAAILLISSSFPIVARILEITSFDLMGNFRHTKYLVHGSYLYLYKFSFMVALAYRFLDLPFSVQIDSSNFRFYIQPKKPGYSPVGSGLSRSSSFDFFDQGKGSLLPFSLSKPSFKSD